MSREYRKNFLYSNNVTVEPFQFWKMPNHKRRYSHECAECGKPHKYRSRNKNPELCKSCSARKTQKQRWQTINHALQQVKQ